MPSCLEMTKTLRFNSIWILILSEIYFFVKNQSKSSYSLLLDLKSFCFWSNIWRNCFFQLIDSFSSSTVISYKFLELKVEKSLSLVYSLACPTGWIEPESSYSDKISGSTEADLLDVLLILNSWAVLIMSLCSTSGSSYWLDSAMLTEGWR